MYGSSQLGRDTPSLELFVLDDGPGRNNESRTGFGLCLSVCLCKNNEVGLQKSTIGY